MNQNTSTTQTTAIPSILKIIQIDYTAMLAVMFPIVIWGLYIAISYFGFLPGLRGRDPIQASQGAPFFFYMGIAALVIGMPVLIWRVRSIQSIFTNGVIVSGQIINIGFHRDRGRVEYSYHYEGQTYQVGNAIQKTKRTKTLNSGDEITVIVDPTNPKKAYIRELYM
jgi:hypothetical protein